MEGIIGTGAELTSTFCIGKGNQAILSQYLGDLKNFETLEFYEETYSRFESLFPKYGGDLKQNRKKHKSMKENYLHW